MVIQWLVGLLCFMTMSVAEATEFMLSNRLIVEQQITISNQPVEIKVWLSSRQIFTRQALTVLVQAQHSSQLPLSLAQVRSDRDATTWLSPMISPEARVSLLSDGRQLSEWHLTLFAKSAGVVKLPHLQLQFEGVSAAKHWMSVPDIPIRVLPLPIFVPTEAWVGELVSWSSSTSIAAIAPVGEQGQRQIHLIMKQLMPQTMPAPLLSGRGVEGLSPLNQLSIPEWKDTIWQSGITLYQPFQLTAAGVWQLSPQDIWVFDPVSWQVTHLATDEVSGYAMPRWLWQLLGLVLWVIVIALVIGILAYGYCRVQQHHFRLDIQRSADALQLYHVLVRHWRLKIGIPVRHQLTDKHPIQEHLLQLEDLLYSQKSLGLSDFSEIRQQLLVNSIIPPCFHW